jgi:hypothetical protein
MITKLRASKISIEMPKEDSEVWVHITVQKVYKNKDTGEIINVIPRWEYISFPLKEIGLTPYEYLDMVTNSNHTSTGYGIAAALSVIVTKKMLELYGGSITEKGDLVL